MKETKNHYKKSIGSQVTVFEPLHCSKRPIFDALKEIIKWVDIIHLVSSNRIP